MAIAPRGYTQPPKRLQRIGVAFGDGPEAAATFALADTIARENGADVTTYTVLAGPARRRAAQTDAVVLRGDVATQLAVASGELELLLTGSRGYGRLRSRLAGGVTSELAHVGHARRGEHGEITGR